MVSLQTHNRVKRQLTQLLKRHTQFQTILDGNNINQSIVPSDVILKKIIFQINFFVKLG